MSSLTNLTGLNLDHNSISNISALSSLTNLTHLNLTSNSISDISPLVSNRGLGTGDRVYVKENSLNAASINTHIPTLQGRGVEVLFDPPQPVTIPDPNLRAAIEKALGKASGAVITTADMVTLTTLDAPNANISNLTGVEYAINLSRLHLGEAWTPDWTNSNSISDISSLSGLTNLTYLNLQGNSISAISAVAGLTNLQFLYLYRNNISDISSVANLTNLTELSLGKNNISNISALSNLTNLTELDLTSNSISDISSLSGLTNLTYHLQDNYIGHLGGGI